MSKKARRLTTGLQVMISPQTKAALDRAAARVDRPSSSLARVFIQRGLGEIEENGQVAKIVRAHLGREVTADEAMTEIALVLLGQDGGDEVT